MPDSIIIGGFQGYGHSIRTFDIDIKGAVRAQRDVVALDGKSFWIQERLEVRDSYPTRVAMGPAWILEIHELERGSISFVVQDREVGTGRSGDAIRSGLSGSGPRLPG